MKKWQFQCCECENPHWSLSIWDKFDKAFVELRISWNISYCCFSAAIGKNVSNSGSAQCSVWEQYLLVVVGSFFWQKAEKLSTENGLKSNTITRIICYICTAHTVFFLQQPCDKMIWLPFSFSYFVTLKIETQ